MASKPGPESRQMFGGPPSIDGSHEDTVNPLQKPTNFHVRGANQLRDSNPHVPVSRLPAEVLSEVFLHLVESGVQGGNTYFVHGTFNFLEVCRRWNEVATGFPQLWSSWIAGAVKAWPLFKFRSKCSPLSLTWRPQLSNSARDILMDPAVPRRTHHLDFSGTSDQLAHFLGVFDSTPLSKVSSIRLQIVQYDNREPREHFSRFLSSPFPKLSKLNVGNFLPDPSSSIFTTSKLTSLKLFLPYGENERYTLAQFSQILQHHPTLEELDLNHGAVPLSGTPGTPVPFVLPRLVDLRLYGTKGAIVGLVDLIGMSSPLHNVVIHIDYTPDFTVPALASAMKKIVVPYYNCRGLDHPRKIDTLTISSRVGELYLTFDAQSHSIPTSNFELQFLWVRELGSVNVVDGTIGLLPSDEIRELTVEGLPLTRRMLQKMSGISHLRLCAQGRRGIEQTLDALALSDGDQPHQHSVPKLESLSLAYAGCTHSRKQLLCVLKERRDHNLGLKELVVRSRPVDEDEDESEFRELVNEVKWDGAAVGDSDDEGVGRGPGHDGSSEGSDDEGAYGFDDDADACKYYNGHTIDSR